MIAWLLLALRISIVAEPGLEDGTQTVFQARGAPLGSTFSLHLLDPEADTAGPAMFARVEREGNALVLRPAVPLSRGLTYRAVVRLPDGSSVTADHTVPEPDAAPPRVEKIYPSAEVLPANLLKFYLHFSEPMREGSEIFELFHIEDENGKRVDSPWREQELWSDEARRLTLWIHPGRIKQGVNLREELGPVLLPGRRYSLVVDASLKSARGVPLGKEVRHAFRTGPEDRERPLPETWKLSPPPSNTREPLRMASPEPLDHALIQRYLVIRNASREKITGTFQIEKGEAAWSLIPDQPWKDEDHWIFIGEMLEDLAGNTPERIFDTDLDEPAPQPGAKSLSFHPTP